MKKREPKLKNQEDSLPHPLKRKKSKFPENNSSEDKKNAGYSQAEDFSVEVPPDQQTCPGVNLYSAKMETEIFRNRERRGRRKQEEVGHDYSEDDDDNDEEEQEKPSKQHVSHGFHLVRGKMDHGMEDYIVAENREIDGHELGLYAIFDGHSGRDVAEYLQSHLFDNILSEPDFWTNPKRAIKRGYEATDEEILDKVVGSRGGSTAVTAIIVDREKLIVANVGDSRAILRRNGTAKQITVDHEPQKEKDIVESRGGFVSKRLGSVPRVDGQLAMTRAFGDGKLKDHITSEPDVIIETIDMDTEFIILASDGLWKVMSNQEASDCIVDLDDAQEASEKLIEEALSRKSADDISSIVVMFQ